MTEQAPVYSADAISFLLEENVSHLREGVWIMFQIPFARDVTYQGYISKIEPDKGHFTRVTVIPFGEAQKRLDEQIHPGLNGPNDSEN